MYLKGDSFYDAKELVDEIHEFDNVVDCGLYEVSLNDLWFNDRVMGFVNYQQDANVVSLTEKGKQMGKVLRFAWRIEQAIHEKFNLHDE
jgi:hypothetical protein